MTDVFFGGSDVERVDLSYHESLQRIVKGDVRCGDLERGGGKRTDHGWD
ncbi:amino acid transporter [Escherichia coli]|uniref:Amino acid transporter n=1 Tax=Escherichia coli TaxID=562 RepID=A0A377D8Z7_ECOLX|nr:amino acid transporter [Escherichia coli]